MDHGTKNVKLAESDKGKYSGKVKTPMNGKYEITLIKKFGEAKFTALAEKEYKYTVLAKQVETDMIEQTKKQNPNVNDQEINYLAQQNYEDLLVSQMNSLKIEIL
jgi:hypothetical protein